MPTPDMSDDELDALFRRGAEAYPDEPPPLGAWARMDDKLRTATVDTLVRRKLMRLVSTGVVILLLTLLAWQGYREFAPRSGRTSEKSASSVANDRHYSSNSSAVISTQPTPDAAGAEAASGSLVNKSTRTKATRTETSERNANSLGTATLGTRSGSQPVAARLLPTPSRPQNVSQRELGAAGLTGGHFAGVANFISSETPPPPAPNSEQQSGSSVASDSATSQLIVAATDTIQSAPADSAAKSAPESALPLYRWNLGLVGGPSASGVRPLEGSRLGGDVGMNVEYRFTPRLRARTGLIRSVKRYAARGSDYAPPDGYWRAGSPILALDANCRITEIPLDLRYELVVRPTYSLFLSTGLTSLLMRNERYTYQYERNGTLTTATWSLARGSNHVLSVLNLSGGVERAVGGRWSVQAEPFVRLPLGGGVGFGQIKLRSAGVAFSVKYGLFGWVSP
ncbi:hypothetical protein ACW9KT_04495 [Hymenobacter sp. HD11105]